MRLWRNGPTSERHGARYYGAAAAAHPKFPTILQTAELVFSLSLSLSLSLPLSLALQ